MYKKSKLIKSIIRNKDKRGSIISLINEEVSNVSIITCNKNSIRSNHYHLEDWHYIFVLKGSINYFYSNINLKKINYKFIKKNQIIFTPPLEFHATHFPEQTSLIVISKNKRNKQIYEKDTIRLNVINNKNYKKYINVV
tara:strand:- start:1770 stop:2186 length:417 start_codon:yes stop_codon:yes gene_type:complete